MTTRCDEAVRNSYPLAHFVFREDQPDLSLDPPMKLP